MGSGNDYFGDYTLSASTLDKFREIEKKLKRDTSTGISEWATIKPVQQIGNDDRSEDTDTGKHSEVAEIEDVVSQVDSPLLPSTQFFFSQSERPHCAPNRVETINFGSLDVAESLYESLENCNETTSLADLMNLSDTEVNGAIEYLSKKLSLKGTYNLCRSFRTINSDRSTVYMKILFGNLLLPKIIHLQEPCRLMNSLINEMTEKFPEDIEEFMYIPLLNEQLKDTSSISAIIGSYPSERKIDLITSFQASVKELKQWHMNVLSQLITTKLTDNVIKDKLVNLLSEKASSWSTEKNYGKFIFFFIKLNSPYTANQKSVMSEMVSLNQTIFKRVMENLLSNMYFHDGMWHIS